MGGGGGGDNAAISSFIDSILDIHEKFLKLLVKLRETLGDMVANVVIYYYFQNILIHETLMGARC